MRRSAALLFALGGASPAAAWLKYPFLNSAAEQSWTPPKETAIADAGYDDWTQGQVAIGWSPRPTEAPKPLFGRMLQPRLDEYTLGPKTCGFIESDANSITCITDGATCTFSDNNVGCCEPNKDCSLIKTTCIDYDAVLQGACNLPDDFHTLCCGTSSLGACFTWILSTTGSGGDDDDHTFTLLDCAPTSGTAVILDYDPSWSSTHIFSTKDTTTTTNSGDSSSTTDGTDAATSSSSGSSGGGRSNVGAIAGGTVGGVVVLALIGLGAFFFLRRRKGKDSASPASTSAHMSQYGPVPTGPSGPTSPDSTVVYPSGVSSNFQGSPPGQYDPSMQYYNNNNNDGYGGPQPQPYGAYGSPSPGYGQSGSPGFAQQQQQQQQGAYGGQYNYQPSSMGSPPPLTGTSPSPGVGVMSENPLHDGANNRHAPSELAAVHPLGNENNRAELG